MVIIGSTAIKHYYPDFPREPKDKDIACLEKPNWTPSSVGKVEYLINPILGSKKGYLNPDIMVTLKASHLCWDINWDKHCFDMVWLMKKGHKIDSKLFWQLYNYWNDVHPDNKRSDLKMSKEEFFTNAVNYDTMEHDEMHKLINPTPIYTKVLKDNYEVELDEDKFKTLSFEEKLEFIREEIYVMSYERYKELGFQRAYHKMFKKFIISHAPLFSLIFIFENYVELHRAKFNYFKLIENGVKTN